MAYAWCLGGDFPQRPFLLARGYGWADRENLEPVHPDSLFRIGSVSKVITTVAVLKLIQDNRASLDQPVFTILNDLSPLSGQMARNVNQVTLRNLLQMSSGWYTQVIDPMFGPWSSRMLYYLNDNIPPDCVTAAQLMMGMPLQFRPGTQYSYSNLNYCILGLVVNKLAGTNYDYKTYENYVKQAVLAPAGITSMQIGDTLPQNRAPGEVKYYRYGSTRADANNAVDNMAKIDGLPYGEAQILQKNFSDGGWIASAIDLVKFLDGLSTYKILNPTMMRIMLARPSFQQKTEGYSSMAWVIKNTAGHTY
ncbi:MAG: beta-lactamase family protein [Coxiellaceae bacterium]|nr:MAG: beta-lactamase family protein [Coxiellaceae bacterium]